MGVVQEADSMVEQVQEDDPGDSGTSFSMDGSGAEDMEQRNRWFPLRPSAVGEDDEDTGQVAYAASAAAPQSNSDQLQSAWSDDDAKQSPPERSQPDGRDGPDLKRTAWMANMYASTQQTVTPAQNQQPPLASGTIASKDSGSDTSALSQPQSDNGNVTPLDIITRSVPPVPRGGASLISELRHRHAPQLNSDSDTESPVSKLLGPNFRAVQQVLDRLKQDRMTDSVSDEAENPASERQSLREESLQSTASTASRDPGTEWIASRPDSEIPTRPSTDAVSSYEMLYSRPVGMLHPSHPEIPHQGDRHPRDESRPSTDTVNSEMPSLRPVGMLYSLHTEIPQQGDRHSRDESHHSSSTAVASTRKARESGPGAWESEPARASSWTSAQLSYRDPSENTPAEATPQSIIPAAMKHSQDHSSQSSTASSITSVRIAGEEYRHSSGDSSEKLSHRDTVPTPLLQSRNKYSTELRPRSSIENSLRSSRIAWGQHTALATDTAELPHHKDRYVKAALPSNAHTSKEHLHELSPHSSIGSSIPTSRITWSESKFTANPTTRALSASDPSESEVSSVLPADNLVFPGHTSSLFVNDTKLAPDVKTTFSSVVEKSNDSNRTGRDHREPLQHGIGSDRSASSDDTDDLLTYEPVFEGDRQYLQKQRRTKRTGGTQRQSDVVERSGNQLPVGPSRDTESSTRQFGHDQPPSTMQVHEGIQGTPIDLHDSQIKALHWSLGAGTISPISFVSTAQLDSQQGKSSTPLGPASERSSVHEAGALQEQSLEEDDTSAQSEDRVHQPGLLPTRGIGLEDRVGAPLKQTESRSTTDVSSSDEIYRPVLYGDVSANKENHPDQSVFKTTSYGIYDIRRSSGPGSTNRRRKALGLQPNPTRETVSQEENGLVYISGSSTPSSVQDSRGRYPLGREEDPTGRATAYREVHQDIPEYYEGRPQRSEEPRKPRTKSYQLEKEADMPRNRQAREVLGKQDIQDLHQDDYLSRKDRKSDHSYRHHASRKDSTVSNGTPEQEAGLLRYTSDRSRQQSEAGPLHYTSDRSRQPPTQYMDITDPNGTSHSLGHGGKRSASSGQSRTRHEDGTAPSSRQAGMETPAGSRKHHLRTSDAKAGHSSRSKSHSRGSKASKLDANISKLSSLISRSLDESISSSSQTSTTTASRRPTSKSKKAKMTTTTTSDSSDVSEFFNYAFFDPRLRSSIGHKLRLRELLRSVKSRDMSPIVRRTRDSSTSPESTSGVSSNDAGTTEREPPPVLTEPRRPEAVERPFPASKLPVAAPKCTCSCLQKPVTQATSAGLNRLDRIQDGDDRKFRMPRMRDVGVNFPTPAVTRRQSSSSDEKTPRVRREDASTQTDKLISGRKVNRKIDTEPEKLQHTPVKSRRNMEEHGVISQPSPNKSDYSYIAEHREPQRKPRERLIASHNSPDHSVKTSTDWRNRTQELAWFFPVTSKPQTEQRTVMQLKTPSKSRTRDEFRVDAFDSVVNPSSSLQKLSLQEAFLYARPHFVKRSKERVTRIEEAAREKEIRKMIAEATEEENRLREAQLKTLKTKTAPVTPKTKTHVKSGKCLQTDRACNVACELESYKAQARQRKLRRLKIERERESPFYSPPPHLNYFACPNLLPSFASTSVGTLPLSSPVPGTGKNRCE